MSMQTPGIGTSGYYPTQSSGQNVSLTQDQLQLIADTLSNYDPDNLTEADAQEIVNTFSEAGIAEGRGLAETMASYGFDARAVGELAGVTSDRPDGPPPPRGGEGVATLNISEDMLQQLNQLLTEYYDGDLTDAEKATTLDAIKDIFQQTMPEGGLVDIRA